MFLSWWTKTLPRTRTATTGSGEDGENIFIETWALSYKHQLYMFRKRSLHKYDAMCLRVASIHGALYSDIKCLCILISWIACIKFSLLLTFMLFLPCCKHYSHLPQTFWCNSASATCRKLCLHITAYCAVCIVHIWESKRVAL